MSTPPTQPVNKFIMHRRVEDVEKLAANCDTAIRELTARFDRQPPRGEKRETGPAGLSITGPAGRDGKDAKDGVGYPGAVGPQGRPGKDCECKTAIAEQLIVRLEQKLAESSDLLTAVRKEFADLKLVIEAIYGQQRQVDEYLAFLKSKRLAADAARQGAKQQ